MILIKRVILFLVLLTTLMSAREEVNISFQNLSIENFIKLVSKITEQNILLNDNIRGSVDLISSAPVYDDEVLNILISVLEAKGYTLIKDGSIMQVVRSNDAAKYNLEVVTANKNIKGTIMVTQAITLYHENVDIIASKIRHLISKAAKLVTMKENNTILITDYPNNIETIKKVILNLEEENKNVVEIISIEHAEIKELHKEVSAIAKQIFNEKIDTQKVTILLNSDTRVLILAGLKKNIEKLKTLITRLDVEQKTDQEVEIYALKNSDSKLVLKTINEIISKQTFTDPTLKPSLSVNEEINAIIVVGEPAKIKSIKQIIEVLDKEKYQVYVQAKVVEISKNGSEAIGFKFGLEGGIVNSSGLYTFAGNFGGSSVANGTFSTALQSKLSSLSFSKAMALGAALDFLKSKGAAKTVSNPSILCVNNQESSIYVGKTISFATGSVAGGTIGSTTTYKREDVGLTLTIKPRVSSEDKVTLDVKVELENVAGTDSESKQPITTKQKVITQAILQHGENVIIGGLVKNSQSNSESKVPVLGDIPYVGALFRHRSDTSSQDHLMVILTPYVISKSEKLSQLQERLGEIGRLQGEYNKEVFKEIEKKIGDVVEDKTVINNNSTIVESKTKTDTKKDYSSNGVDLSILSPDKDSF